MSFGEARGEVRGRLAEWRAMLLRVWSVRGAQVTEAQRARVMGCNDAAQFDAWVDATIAGGAAVVVLGG